MAGGLGLGGSSSGGGNSVIARSASVSATATGAVYTAPHYLGAGSTFSLVSGSNANLAINSTTGVISATAALGAGVSQLAIVREAIAAQNLAEEYPLTLTGAAAAPGAATISVSTGNQQNTITIVDGAANGSAITARKLYRSTSAGFTPGPGNLVNANVTSPYQDTGLTNGTAYYYQVILTNGVGDSGASNEASGTPIAFTTLPTLSQTYSAGRGTQVMITGYSGNLYRLRNAANSSFVDIAAAPGSNVPADVTITNAITTLGGTAYFAKIYDQTGNGFDLILPTTNSATIAVDITQKTVSGGLWVNSADGASQDMASTGHSISSQNFSLFAVMQQASNQLNATNLFSIDNGTTTYEGLIAGPTNQEIRSRNSSGYTSYSGVKPLRANPCVFGITDTASARRLYMNETSVTAAAPALNTATRVQYFGQMKTGADSTGYCRWAGDALTSAALSTGDGTTLQSSLATMFGVPTTFDRRLLVFGDSIAYGYLQGLHHTIWEQLALTTTSNVEIICCTLTGQKMGAYNTSAFPLAYVTSAYGAGKMVTVVELGINDIDPAVGSSPWDYTALSSRATTAINGIKAQYTSGRVLQTQLLPCAQASWNATQEGYRIQYNTDVASNTFGAHAVFLQGDTSSTMGSPPTWPGGTGGAPNNSTLYNTDKLHPTQAGAALLATGGQASPPSGFASYQAAINSLWF